MENLRYLLESLCVQASGKKAPEYPTEDQATDFQQSCKTSVHALMANSETLFETARIPQDAPAAGGVLFYNLGVVGHLASVLQQQFRSQRKSLPQGTAAQLDRFDEFLPSAAEGMLTLIYAHIADLGYGASPASLEGRKDAIIRGAALMSGYPAVLSATIRDMMSTYIDTAVVGGDLSIDFSREVRNIFRTRPISFGPDALGFCPAHGAMETFASVFFDVFLKIYAEVHGRIARRYLVSKNIQIPDVRSLDIPSDFIQRPPPPQYVGGLPAGIRVVLLGPGD